MLEPRLGWFMRSITRYSRMEFSYTVWFRLTLLAVISLCLWLNLLTWTETEWQIWSTMMKLSLQSSLCITKSKQTRLQMIHYASNRQVKVTRGTWSDPQTESSLPFLMCRQELTLKATMWIRLCLSSPEEPLSVPQQVSQGESGSQTSMPMATQISLSQSISRAPRQSPRASFSWTKKPHSQLPRFYR